LQKSYIRNRYKEKRKQTIGKTPEIKKFSREDGSKKGVWSKVYPILLEKGDRTKRSGKAGHNLLLNNRREGKSSAEHRKKNSGSCSL